MNELYRLHNVQRVFGRRTVLSIDSLTIEQGRVYGLLGPNGSGKSTLLKLLAFLEEPDDGTIFFKGQKVTPRDMPALRAHAVLSTQFPVMFSGTTLYNVEYPMRLKKTPAPERRQRALAFLEKVGLAHLAEAKAPKLSGGEAQRVSLARALAAGAEVLLLDEPTANLDRPSRESLLSLIEKLQKEHHLSIIIATHDHNLETELCQQLINLRDGRIC